MVYRGTVRCGVVELEPGAKIPDGTQVRVEPLEAANGETVAAAHEVATWPEGYFEQTFGSIDDETFARPPQGDLPDAVDFE